MVSKKHSFEYYEYSNTGTQEAIVQVRHAPLTVEEFSLLMLATRNRDAKPR